MNQNDWPIAKEYQRKRYVAIWRVRIHPEGFYVIECDMTSYDEKMLYIESETEPCLETTPLSILNFADKKQPPWKVAIQGRANARDSHTLRKKETLKVGDYVKFDHPITTTDNAVHVDGVVTHKKGQTTVFNHGTIGSSAKKINHFKPRIIKKQTIPNDKVVIEGVETIVNALGLKEAPKKVSCEISANGSLIVYFTTPFNEKLFPPGGEDISMIAGTKNVMQYEWGSMEVIYKEYPRNSKILIVTYKMVFHHLLVRPVSTMLNPVDYQAGNLTLVRPVAEKTKESATAPQSALWF